MRSLPRLLILAGVGALAAGPALAQSCQPYWAALPRLQLAGSLIFYAVFDDGAGPELYAALGDPVRYLRWRSQRWEQLPVAGLPAVRSAAYDFFRVMDDGTGPALYSLIQLTSTTTGAVRWRNETWEQLPSAFWQHDVAGRAVPLGCADVGDGVHIYGSLPIGRVVRWNGQSWDTIGQAGGNGDFYLNAAVGYNDGRGAALYVFGDFTTMNGQPVAQFGKWDGQNWSNPWPGGTGGYSGLPLVAIFDNGDGPKLYCDFAPAINGVGHRGLNRWDGTDWEFLGGPDTFAPEFYGLHAFDDGSGPALYLTGLFSNFAGLPARHMVRFDAQGFHVVPGSDLFSGTQGQGVIRDARGESLVFDANINNPPSYFQTVGQLVGCRVPTCAADCNADGRLDVLDFMCFLNDYAAFDPYANTQADGFFNVQDFVAFMDRFAAGCS